MSNRSTVHFHDGPWHGKTADLRPDVDVLPAGDGHYFRDPVSAGGACMSWEPDYAFEEILSPPTVSNSTAITEGPENGT